MKTNDAAILRQYGWLSETPAAFQDSVLKKSDRMNLGVGEAVYHPGDEAGGLIGMVEGYADLHIDGRGGDHTLSHIVGPGFWSGGFAAITGNPRRIGMVARTAVTLMRLPRVEMLRIAEQSPEGWRYLSVLAARNLLTAIDLIDSLKRPDPVDRLAMVLRNLSADSPTEPEEIPVSQSDLAALACLSRSSVNRALGRLVAHGLVRTGYRTIRISDQAALSRFCYRVTGEPVLVRKGK